MILFVMFYMQAQMSDYIKKRTTMTTRFEMLDELEFPTMTICVEGGMKPSVKDEYGLSENHEFWFDSNSYGPSENLSYILSREFTIGISHWITLEHTLSSKH